MHMSQDLTSTLFSSVAYIINNSRHLQARFLVVLLSCFTFN
uniref:Uncharacterized protein n=1 Tax=Arundo donax TaxID=35708 RepID=A0A0A8ZVM7_ARUDO